MNLKLFSNEDLISNLKNLVKTERRVSTEILHHLREVEARDIHLSLGYNSLFTYMTEELKYAESAAGRRLAALRLLYSIPAVEAKKVEEKINSGEVSITTVAMVQDLIRHKKKEAKPLSTKEKVELLYSIDGLSKKETEKLLISKAPQMATREKERVIDSELTELKIVVNEKVLRKLKRIKELRSHMNQSPTYAELLEDMANLVLKRIDPLEKAEPKKIKNEVIDAQTTSTFPGELRLKSHHIQSNYTKLNSTQGTPGELVSSKKVTLGEFTKHIYSIKAAGKRNDRSRYIPGHIRQKVWLRDGGKCTFVNNNTGNATPKICNSTYLLQVEHKTPYAYGGEHSLENLTLHCAHHNLFKMRESFFLV